MTEFESKQLLETYSIPVSKALVAATAEQAADIAASIGFPVAVKLNSLTLTHKAEVGGVKLLVQSPDGVRAAFLAIQASVTEKAGAGHFAGVSVQPMILNEGVELIVGSFTDPQFGPVLLLGAGGQLVDVFQDRALALPPLNTVLARRFIERTKILKALLGVRGRKPVDLSALECLLVNFSQLVVEHPEIKEVEINPLLASPDGLISLDARVVLHSAGEENIPKLAIRPYPRKYSTQVTLKDGMRLEIRPIRPEDEPRLVEFHTALSEESVFRRFFTPMSLENRIRHENLTRMCFIDYNRQMALIAQRLTPEGLPGEIIGVGRLIKLPLTNEAEIAAITMDSFQRKGIGRLLTAGLLQFGCDEKLSLLRASVLVENPGMQRLLESLGFIFRQTDDPSVLEGEMQL